MNETNHIKEENNTTQEGVLGKFMRKTGDVSNNDHQRLFNAIPFILFLVLLAVIQIANKHNAENKIRTIERMQKELRELRWQYMSKKSELMQKSRQSEVAKILAPTGMYELRTPPRKIIVKKESEHQ